MNRINRIDQSKALKDMRRIVEVDKNGLLARVELAERGKFVV